MTDARPEHQADLEATVSGLRGERQVLPTHDELIDHLGQHLYQFARHRVQHAGVFHLALSGGSTPELLYQRLMIDPTYRYFPWPATHLWLVDERCVELDDEQSNYRMIRPLLDDHSDIPHRQVHPMPVTDAVGDHRYEDDMKKALRKPGCDGRLDFILLGMGADGHTASLFPDTPALRETDRWTVVNDGETVAEPRPRMTLTYPVINSTRRIALLVTGSAKHATLQHVAVAGEDPQRFPVSGVKPIYDDTEMIWYLDHAAVLGPKMDEEQT